ncbi:MAG: hypothetical protein MZV63_25855 [Marinilabiliales bacterium]|nr:hypothetical protein [Marinilabiliales bacterium]
MTPAGNGNVASTTKAAAKPAQAVRRGQTNRLGRRRRRRKAQYAMTTGAGASGSGRKGRETIQPTGRGQKKPEEKRQNRGGRAGQKRKQERRGEKEIAGGHDDGHQRNADEVEKNSRKNHPVKGRGHDRHDGQLGGEGKGQRVPDFQGKGGQGGFNRGKKRIRPRVAANVS